MESLERKRQVQEGEVREVKREGRRQERRREGRGRGLEERKLYRRFSGQLVEDVYQREREEESEEEAQLTSSSFVKSICFLTMLIC